MPPPSPGMICLRPRDMADFFMGLMAKNHSGEKSPPPGTGEHSSQPRVTLGRRARQAGLFVLSGAILMIPRIRRLRRRAGAWAGVRLGVGACGTWLVWRHQHAGAGTASLVGGLLLFAFSLLVRAKPEAKPTDAIARELGALIVLDGGTFLESPDSTPIAHARILVHPEQIIVMGPGERRLLEIPLAKVRNMTVHPVSPEAGEGADLWEVEIDWVADAPGTTTFQYAGVFAAHLAQVAESTLRRQWKEDLPVIHP